uniref:Peptidase S1 domain-containing protein n=1 Tax=Panagrellus redivivus TaxID=6233 RepID=A0A7E4VS78_PANRE
MTLASSLAILALITNAYGATYNPVFCGDTVVPLTTHKIMGGVDAKPDQFPNAVAIFRNDHYICSGSLIAPGIIITAAHCFMDRKKQPYLDIVCGDDKECIQKYLGIGYFNKCKMGFYDIENIKETVTVLIGGLPLDSDVKRLPVIDVDPSYVRFFHRGCVQHDIAILKVEDTGNARYSCVSSRINVRNLVNAMAIGWGGDAIKDLTTHNKLQLLDSNIVHPRDECIHKTSGDFPVDGICIDEFQDRNSCSGDSGGPLLAYQDFQRYKHRLVTLGVLSFGSNCKLLRENKAPGGAVYTRLDFYHNMINTVLGLDGFYDDLSFTADVVNHTLEKATE